LIRRQEVLHLRIDKDERTDATLPRGILHEYRHDLGTKPLMLKRPRPTEIWRAVDRLTIEQVSHCEVVDTITSDASVWHSDLRERTRLPKPE
jgi:hypothetical protein